MGKLQLVNNWPITFPCYFNRWKLIGGLISPTSGLFCTWISGQHIQWQHCHACSTVHRTNLIIGGWSRNASLDLFLICNLFGISHRTLFHTKTWKGIPARLMRSYFSKQPSDAYEALKGRHHIMVKQLAMKCVMNNTKNITTTKLRQTT